MTSVIETFRAKFMELAKLSKTDSVVAALQLRGYCLANPQLSEGLELLYQECEKEIQKVETDSPLWVQN